MLITREEEFGARVSVGFSGRVRSLFRWRENGGGGGRGRAASGGERGVHGLERTGTESVAAARKRDSPRLHQRDSIIPSKQAVGR